MPEAVPLLSVCIITYNHEQFIRQAIDSVLLQECTFPIEIVIGEDCSTDSTGAICQEYARKYAHVKLLDNETNLGMVNNFLRTSKACTGKYIAMLEGDDYWTDPHKLQKQVDFLEANPDFVLCFHNKKHQQYANVQLEGFYEHTSDKTFIAHEVFEANIHTLTVVFRNVLKNHPLHTQFNTLPLYDFALWAYLSLHGKCAYLNFVGANYRLHNTSVFSSNNVTDNSRKMMSSLIIIRGDFPISYQPKFDFYILLLLFMITEELRLQPFSAKYLYYLSVLFVKSRQFSNREFTDFYRSLYKTRIKRKIKSVFGMPLETV